MKRNFFGIVALFMLVSLALTACFPSLTPDTGDSAPNKATQDAQIAEAVSGTATRMAMETQIADLQAQLTQAANVQPGVITATPGQATEVAAQETTAPTATPLPTSTPLPTATLVPTLTPTAVPTATLMPSQTPTNAPPTATAIPCNAAKFEADVTIPDGTVVAPGSTFTKTWRLRNTGACTWTTAYDVIFVGGDQMSAPSVFDLPGNVAAGQVIDISVTMVAPTQEGRYRANWKLRDASGINFGVGMSSTSFFADIRVVMPQSTGTLNFVNSYCLAEWTAGSNNLPCPGADNDSRGFVQRIDKPKLESGYLDDEPVLLTHPQMITDGVIRGKYPPFRVESNHHFVATIGCAYQATACDVNFQLDYQIGSGAIQTLKTWHEKYEEKFAQVDVDLSSLAGKDVRFILTVFANGSHSQDRAQWLLPRIIKK